MNDGLLMGEDYGSSMKAQRVQVKVGQGASTYRGEAIVWGTADDITAGGNRSMGGAPQVPKQDFVIKVPVTKVANLPVQSTAIMLTTPDGGVAGGNARGLGAIDLQYYRTAADQVAGPSGVVIGSRNKVVGDTTFGGTAIGVGNTSQGQGSVALGYLNNTNGGQAVGVQNTATNTSAVGMGVGNNVTGQNGSGVGSNNTVSGQYGTGIGYNNTASSLGATSLGNSNIAAGTGSTSVGTSNNVNSTSGTSTAVGNSNTCSGASTSVALGYTNANSATYSITIGQNNTGSGAYSSVIGYQGTSQGITGKEVFSEGQITSVGDNQFAKYLFKRRTTDATATVLTTNNAAASTTNQAILSNYSSYGFIGTIVALRKGSEAVDETKVWKIEGAIRRGANAASTTLVGIPTVSVLGADINAAAWAIALSADTTNGGLAITVTGETGKNIQWSGYIDCAESIYA